MPRRSQPATSFPAPRALRYAVAHGPNLKLAPYLLYRGGNPNRCLSAPVWADDLEGADVGVRRYSAALDELGEGETPLIYSIRHSRVRIGEWLIDQGAEVGVRDGADSRPCIMQCGGGRIIFSVAY